MAKISLFSTVGAALMVASVAQSSFVETSLFNNRFSLQEDNTNMFDQDHLQYYMSCGKGAIDGFMKGFYANNTEGISDDCLGQTTYTHVSEFFGLLTSGQIMDIFKSFGKFYQVSFDI